MDLWKEIEKDIDFCYGDSSDNVIQNVFLDSVASSTPARHPEFGNDTNSSDLTLTMDLKGLTGDAMEDSPVSLPDLVIDNNFDQMIDQILDEIDLNNNTDSIVTIPTQPKPFKECLPFPLAESTPKKNAVSILKDTCQSSQLEWPLKDMNYDHRIMSHASPTSSQDQVQQKFGNGYKKTNLAGFRGNAPKKYKLCSKKQSYPKAKLVSVLKPLGVPNKVSIGNFFSNFSPDVNTIRKLDRLPKSDVSVADYPEQVATVTSIYLTPRSEDFIRHLKKEKERQRRQEMSIYRDVLKELVPSVSCINKVSTLTVLCEARKYCKHINAQVLQLQDSVQFEIQKNIYLLSVLENMKN